MNNIHYLPPSFASPYDFPQAQGAPMAYTNPQYPLHTTYSNLQYMYHGGGYQPHRPPMMVDRGLCDGKTESKPRLSKEEVQKLEKVFQDNPKPSSSVKAQLADGLGLERPRINNWFQNRRAKAKQERKQEEYEARRRAEKSASEPSSPDDDSYSGTLDSLSEGSQKRTQPSSAAFPVSSPSQITDLSNDEEDEEEEDSDDEENEDETDEAAGHGINDTNSINMQSSASASTQATPADMSDAYQSPVSMDYTQSDSATFAHTTGGYAPSKSVNDFGVFAPLGHDNNTTEFHDGLPRTFELHDGSPRTESSFSGESHNSQQYASIHTTALPSLSTTAMFFSPVSNGDACEMSGSPFDTSASPECHNGQASHVVAQGMPTPTDSFKSPPPPANIATRRNMAGPLALQAASLRSRSFNVPKTALDGHKRSDITSPITSMRRISSATGMGPGRIQKPTAGPRSPYFGRHEALMQYRNQSPIGSRTSTFPGAAPPTPMTPALFEQHHGQEPTVISASPGDSSYVLGMGLPANLVQEIKEEHDLKTPPTTPGLITDFGTNGYIGNAFSGGFNITTDQPLMTPFFHSEFPDMTAQNVPGYVETSDGSPSTPVYPNMMGSSLEHPTPFTGNAMANTQYDWDANESVVSSRSSPGYPRSKQIQFTPNITPQDYH
ncbi:hypothetical protein F4777DRAFT_352993 [Nemania sp. FL0916]|nr:hypothetical protein F4777DRAFT_352993 [Nemania sp. FL0916]